MGSNSNTRYCTYTLATFTGGSVNETNPQTT